MSFSNLEQAFQLISNTVVAKENDFRQGCSLETIINAESILKTEFPESYKRFLEKYGCGGIGSFEIYGLDKEETFEDQKIPFYPTPNVVWTLLKYHRDFNHPLHLPIIHDLGEGSLYCLDLSQMKYKECPIIVWTLNGYENNRKLEIVAKDFGEFFLEMVQQKIRS